MHLITDEFLNEQNKNYNTTLLVAYMLNRDSKGNDDVIIKINLDNTTGHSMTVYDKKALFPTVIDVKIKYLISTLLIIGGINEVANLTKLVDELNQTNLDNTSVSYTLTKLQSILKEKE